MKNQFAASRSARAVLLALALALADVSGAQSTARKPPPAKSAPAQPAQQASAPCTSVEMGPAVNLTVGKSTLIRLQSPVTRILLGNPEQKAARPVEVPENVPEQARPRATATDTSRSGVADMEVVLLSPQEIYLLGKTIGSTNIVLLDRSGRCTVMDVIVGMDTAPLRASFTQLLPSEKSIVVTAAADSLVLTGVVSDGITLDRAVDLANVYVRRGASGAGGQDTISPRVVNMLSVSAPQQVMLEVKVAEVSKSLVDKLGASFNIHRTTGGWTYTLLANFLTSGGSLLDAFRKATGEFVTIDAENKDGLVKILAEPTVMAISGQEGSFLAGGRIFIPVAQNNNNGVLTITLEEKEFGVGLRFTPTVLDGGRINLRVSPEVSELSREGVGVTAAGVAGQAILPLITTRRASTTVQLMDGQSFAIGGLVKNNITQNVRALPVLGEVPVLGALFRSTDFETDKSELLFVVTPRLVKPLPADYRLPTDAYVQPSKIEAFIGGKMEGSAAAPNDAGPQRTVPAPTPTPAAPAGPSGFEIK